MPDLTRQSSTSTASGGSTTTTQTQSTTSASGSNAERAERLKQSQNPKHTGIVHFGLNGGAKDEAAHLNKLNAEKGGAVSIRNQKEQDVLTRNNKRMDLATKEGVEAWGATLGMAKDVVAKVSAVITSAGSGARDELAQLVEVYGQAEIGVRRMDRLVLSGHNVGEEMWGDDNGAVPFKTFVALHDIFPKAAAQVRHLLVSACYSGGEQQMDLYKKAFPSLLSIMAYTGSSPGTASGGLNHIGRWEKATEKGDGSNVDSDIAKNTRKGENVSTWNATDGYQGDKPKPYEELRDRIHAGEAMFHRYFDDGQVVANAQSGELRDYYNLLQSALRHREIPESDRAGFVGRRDIVIRLLFYPLIRGKFAQTYAAKIAAGYKGVQGISAPDYAKLDRLGAINAVKALEAASTADTRAADTKTALDLLQRGLIQLSNELIPSNWI